MQGIFWVFEIRLCRVLWFVCLVFDPSTLGGHNFLISKPFLTLFSASDAPRGGVQFLLEQKKQRSPPLGSGLP
jgi:hypothetical protein